jgi:hypothetical protein
VVALDVVSSMDIENQVRDGASDIKRTSVEFLAKKLCPEVIILLAYE